MKKILFASILALGVSPANATFLDAITGANGANITFEDNSREEFVDVDGNGIFNAGDQLQGFLRFDSFSPPSTTTNNDLYVTFTQTFGADFTATPAGGIGTVYSGSFSDVTLNFVDYTGAADYGVDDLSGGIAAAIADIESNGTIAFSAGLVNPEDFFAFETEVLVAGDTDFIIDPTRLDHVDTSLSLGTFAAGLTITANNIPVIFNRAIASNFSNGINFFGFGDVYDLAIVNGNFGGTCEAFDGAGNCTQNVQNLTGGLVDNADAVLNATRIPEPTSLALLGLGLLGLSYTKRKA